jgi:spore coat polysaccharide biosynthesis protein SpsF (cytidylyltransferase family)
MAQVLAIVQARMGSKRFSEKVMKMVCGKPLIGHMLYRLGSSKQINKTVLATSVEAVNDPLVQYVQSLGIEVFRGSEEDVLERFYFCAREHRAEHIMRLTGDCPLIDPTICDDLIEIYFKKNVDYAHTGLSFAEGLGGEVFSYNALEKSYHETTLRSEREHVTQYMYKHPEIFTKYVLENNTNDSRYRITVDEPEDFLVVQFVFEALAPKEDKLFTAEDIKNVIDSRPDIFRFNAHIVRGEGLKKSLQEDSFIK